MDTVIADTKTADKNFFFINTSSLVFGAYTFFQHRVMVIIKAIPLHLSGTAIVTDSFIPYIYISTISQQILLFYPGIHGLNTPPAYRL